MRTKVAMVTGSAKRVGAAIVSTLHSQGYRVIVHYQQSAAAAESLVAQLNQVEANSAQKFQADLNNQQQLDALANNCAHQWGRLDVLVNNASAFYPTPLGDITETQWDELFASNAKAPFFLAQALAPELKKNRGSIVNICDIYGERPLKNHTVYCMAKAANIMLTQSLAIDLAPDVSVNGIAPGAILWPSHQQAFSTEHLEKIRQLVPQQTPGSTEAITKAVSYLLEESNYLTGEIIHVDGGRHLNL